MTDYTAMQRDPDDERAEFEDAEADRIVGRFLDHLTHEAFSTLNDYKEVLKSCRTLEEAKAVSERLDLLAKLVSQAQDDAADLVNQLEA